MVAWHGTHTAYLYDLARFNAMGAIGFDHPDPSICTVLTSRSGTVGQADVDSVFFLARCNVSDHSFRPPHFHRTVRTEFMGLIEGAHDSKAEGFVPGGGSPRNMWAAHGPDREIFDAAGVAELLPQKIERSAGRSAPNSSPAATGSAAPATASSRPSAAAPTI